MSEYSEKAQAAARVVLSQDSTDPGAVFDSLTPFIPENDIPGANLVMKAWMSIGAKLVHMAKFARDNRHDPDYAPVLEWFNRELLVEGSSKPHGNWDMHAEDRRAQAWIDDYRGIVENL